jgi:hypothetical protein
MAAAQVAMAGMNAMTFLRSRSVDERSIFQAIAAAADARRKEEREDLAVLIHNHVAKLLSKVG